MALKLYEVNKSLIRLTRKLDRNVDIKESLVALSARGRVIGKQFAKVIEIDGFEVLTQKAILESTSELTDVSIVNIQQAIKALCNSLRITSDNLFSLQKGVQDNIEKCKKRKKQHDSGIKTKRSHLKAITIQLKIVKSDVKAYEKKAKKLDTRAADLEKNGEELRQMSEKSKQKTAVGGIVEGIVGLVLAPANGLTSLLLAASGVTGDTAENLPEANNCGKRAQEMREQAKSTRKEAIKCRKKKQEITNKKNALELEITPLEKDADELSKAWQALKEITEILFSISNAMDHCQQAVQNIEARIMEVHLRADAFKIIQLALQNKPGRFEERAQICFESIKESWVMLEHFLSENCARHTGVEH